MAGPATNDPTRGDIAPPDVGDLNPLDHMRPALLSVALLTLITGCAFRLSGPSSKLPRARLGRARELDRDQPEMVVCQLCVPRWG
jgi:hypothetical protein